MRTARSLHYEAMLKLSLLRVVPTASQPPTNCMSISFRTGKPVEVKGQRIQLIVCVLKETHDISLHKFL